MNRLVLKHKSFKAKGMFATREGGLERAREAAESFINSIGAEKLVTAAENWFDLTVTVWYREEDDTQPSKDVMPEP